MPLIKPVKNVEDQFEGMLRLAKVCPLKKITLCRLDKNKIHLRLRHKKRHDSAILFTISLRCKQSKTGK